MNRKQAIYTIGWLFLAYLMTNAAFAYLIWNENNRLSLQRTFSDIYVEVLLQTGPSLLFICIVGELLLLFIFGYERLERKTQ